VTCRCRWRSEDRRYRFFHSFFAFPSALLSFCRGCASTVRQGRRNWSGKSAEQAAVYGNRRRIRGERGKRLLRRRGELVERAFAHLYETGGMRRTHFRGHTNILKRLLIHTGAINLGLILRQMVGVGKPRRLQGSWARFFRSFSR